MSKILIIDDDDQLRKSFEKLLIEEGYHVRTAALGGIRDQDRCESETVDLVIVDVRLPGINGLETFARIHALEPKLPVIIMTAYGTTETAIEATKLGAFDYVSSNPSTCPKCSP